MSLASGVTALASRLAQEVNALRSETSSGLATKAALAHTHAEGDVTSLTTDLAGKAAASHTHAEGDVASLTSDLAGKAATVHTHAAADVTSGTLTIARIPTGTTSSTVALGNDTRLSDQRTPSDGSVTNTKVATSAAIAESKLALASDAAAGTASRRTLGTGATQAAPGDHDHSEMPQGVVARGIRTTNATSTAGAAEQMVIALGNITVTAGRVYRVVAPSLGIYGSIGGANVYAQINVRYTTNGATPNTSSSQLIQAVIPIPAAGVGYSNLVEGHYLPASSGSFRVALSYTGSAGNNATMQAGAAYPITLLIYDMGIDPGNTGTNL